jgi:hypothetical protein
MPGNWADNLVPVIGRMNQCPVIQSELMLGNWADELILVIGWMN